jgi:hypothetical protein
VFLLGAKLAAPGLDVDAASDADGGGDSGSFKPVSEGIDPVGG